MNPKSYEAAHPQNPVAERSEEPAFALAFAFALLPVIPSEIRFCLPSLNPGPICQVAHPPKSDVFTPLIALKANNHAASMIRKIILQTLPIIKPQRRTL